jgi:spore maturation protein CgeB
MRFLMLDPYYPAFLDSVYRETPDLAERPYRDQWRHLMDRAFGTADFYSSNLRRLGHEADEIVPNCVPLQEQWWREYGEGASLPGEPGDLARLATIMLRQVRHFRPDVLHVQDCISLGADLVRQARPWARRITTQIACPMPEDLDFSPYDLVLSSMPHFVSRFRRSGLRAAHLRLAFEPSLLERIAAAERRGVVFVGGVSPAHGKRLRLLEALAVEGLVEWWGYGVDQVAAASPLRARYHGEAWGLEMYERLAGCAIALNDHIDVAGEHANNMRLFEATGMGALLLTDRKLDLRDYFEPGTEVVAYGSPQECAESIRYYLERPGLAREIADRGQRRTLAEYTYRQRMEEFAGLAAALL